jgi:hypothetical protein
MAKDPVLIAFTARRTTSGKTIWTEIGHAIPHETGAGLTVLLSAMPTDGRIILLEPTDRDYDKYADRLP